MLGTPPSAQRARPLDHIREVGVFGGQPGEQLPRPRDGAGALIEVGEGVRPSEVMLPGTLRADGAVLERPERAVEVAAFRIVQEALTNVNRHAHAHRATVTLDVDGDELLLTVCDDGVGLSTARDDGLGLHSMRARAEELGGRLTIRPNNPAGCCIHAQLPLETGDPHGADSHSDL